MPDARSQTTAVFSTFALALPLVSIFASAGTVLLLLLAAVLAALTCWRSGQRLPRPDRGSVIALAVLLVWSAVTAIWALSPAGSLLLSIRLAALFAGGFLLHACATTLSDAQRDTVGRWLTVGLLIGLVFLAEEIVFDYRLMALVKGPNTTSLSASLNRGATALAMLSWPVAAYLWQRGLRWQAAALPVAAAGVLLASESQAAGLAMVAGALVIAVALAHRQAGRFVLIGTCVALFAGAPFIAELLNASGWHNAAWLPQSSRHRVEIWYSVADLIAQKPLLGWGFDASRAIGDGVPLHPHNASLQVLLELGAVGGAIAVANLWVFVTLLDRFPAPSRIFAQACFAATLAIASTAYGVWQNQWLATIFSTALLIYATRPGIPNPAAPSLGGIRAAPEMPQQHGHGDNRG